MIFLFSYIFIIFLGPRDHPDIVDSFMQLLAQVCFSFLFIHFLFSLFLFFNSI